MQIQRSSCSVNSLKLIYIQAARRKQTIQAQNVRCLILDSTAPVQSKQGFIYGTIIKVIDESFNCLTNSIPYCLITLKSQREEKLRVYEIGSMIHMSKCQFKAGQTYFEGKVHLDNEFKIQSTRNKPSFSVAKVTWFQDNFKKLFSPKLGLRCKTQRIIHFAPFSLILRIASVKKTEKFDYFSYQLKDAAENIYKYCQQGTVPPGSYVIINNITHIDSSKTIWCDGAGWMLQLPCQVQLRNIQAVYPNTLTYNKQSDFVQETRQLTTVKIKINTTEETISLAELAKACQRYVHDLDDEINLKDGQIKYTVLVYPERIIGGVKLYDTQTMLKYNIETVVNNDIYWNPDSTIMIYDIVFEVRDNSLCQELYLVKLHLFTADGNGQAFFPDIDLQEYAKNIKNYKQNPMTALSDLNEISTKLNNWYDVLITNCDPTKQLLRLALEPIYSLKNVDYRIVDTVLAHTVDTFPK